MSLGGVAVIDRTSWKGKAVMGAGKISTSLLVPFMPALTFSMISIGA